MMRLAPLARVGLALALLAAPAFAQFTVLDQAQDSPAATTGAEGAPAADPSAPPPPCGTEPFAIARMNWPSAMLLAEIHARLLTSQFGCTVQLTPGDLAPTASSMGSSQQPAAAPEMWVNRVAELWNAAMDAQAVRSAAPTFGDGTLEGWYMPSYMASGLAAPPSAAGLADLVKPQPDGSRTRFISCPIDWACAVINRNLIAAYGLDAALDVVEPVNRLDMDRLIAEAINRREPFLFYYWQPNAVLAQLDFTAIDMGAYDEAAAKCLASRTCADPKPSAFPPDLVVIALAERVFADMPAIASYFQRASLPLAEMNTLLAQLTAPEATPESVAERFIAERGDLWQAWVGSAQ